MQLFPQNKRNNNLFILPFMTQTSPDEHTDTLSAHSGCTYKPVSYFSYFLSGRIFRALSADVTSSAFMLNVSDHSATTASQQTNLVSQTIYVFDCSYLCKHNVDFFAADDLWSVHVRERAERKSSSVFWPQVSVASLNFRKSHVASLNIKLKPPVGGSKSLLISESLSH